LLSSKDQLYLDSNQPALSYTTEPQASSALALDNDPLRPPSPLTRGYQPCLSSQLSTNTYLLVTLLRPPTAAYSSSKLFHRTCMFPSLLPSSLLVLAWLFVVARAVPSQPRSYSSRRASTEAQVACEITSGSQPNTFAVGFVH
jgi:hypothetical protein